MLYSVHTKLVTHFGGYFYTEIQIWWNGFAVLWLYYYMYYNNDDRPVFA